MSFKSCGLALAAAFTLSQSASAQLFSYSSDFESMSFTDPGAIAADGWIVFGYVVDNMGNFAYGYGPFPAPNMTGGFSSLGNTLGGPAQGTQYLDIFSDYLNGDHANNFRIESNVFIEQTISAADVGQVATFDFDYLQNPANTNSGGATTDAFIKIFQSSDGSFNVLGILSFDTTMASTTTWTSGQLQVTIDPTWEGETLQFGFSNTATNFEDTSRLYDNISFSTPTTTLPMIEDYSQDFEAMNLGDANALADDDWVVFANVFDANGTYQYGYGTFPAPNPGVGFSSLATGAGGANQGAQYINVYSDYNNGDHGNGLFLDSLVFREDSIGAQDVGRTLRFSMDYLKNGQVTNGDGNSTTGAFIKILKQSDFTFAELAADRLDTTGADTMNWASGFVEVTIEPSHVGELLQFGFESYATNFEDTGRFYDNLTLEDAPVVGTNYCTSNPNSSGNAATISVEGSNVASDNNLTLMAEGMPNNQFGIFIVSASQTQSPLANGFLCVSGSIGRYRGPGQIQPTGTTGSFQLPIDLTAIPQGNGTVPTNPGQTWNFQAWFRDGVGAGSNTTDGVQVDFQ